MEDNDFFDHIYQLWSKTTLAENGYWMPTEHDLETDRRFSIDAVESEDSSIRVAAGLSEADVDFLTAVHGCFPDLIRRLRMAMDEAENLDLRVDDQEGEIASLVIEISDLQGALDSTDITVGDLEKELQAARDEISELKSAVEDAESEAEYWQDQYYGLVDG